MIKNHEMLGGRFMLLFLAGWLAPIIRSELSWMILAPDCYPCEESRGRPGMGIGCILGLLGRFLLRLDTRSFCSYCFSLEEAYCDFFLLIADDTEPSLLPSYLISTSFPLLFFSSSFKRISVFLAPSASSLMSIHSW